MHSNSIRDNVLHLLINDDHFAVVAEEQRVVHALPRPAREDRVEVYDSCATFSTSEQHTKQEASCYCAYVLHND